MPTVTGTSTGPYVLHYEENDRFSTVSATHDLRAENEEAAVVEAIEILKSQRFLPKQTHVAITKTTTIKLDVTDLKLGL